MAGDWIKFEVGTHDKPEVWNIASELDIDPDAVVGKLLRVWGWFDQHTEEGNAPIVTKMLLDRLVGVIGFCQSLVNAGWMAEDGGMISLPNFERHNGKTAKNRAVTAKRVAAHKARLAEINDESNAEVTEDALPKEEKNKEEKNKEINMVFDHWVSVMRKDSKKTKLTDGRRKKIAARLKDYDVQDLLAAVDGCAASSFHMGDNKEGKQHNDIDLIFRNGEKLESFRDMKPARQPEPIPPKTGDQINPHGRY